VINDGSVAFLIDCITCPVIRIMLSGRSLTPLFRPPSLLLLTLVILLGLVTALLLGTLVKRGDKILKGAYKVCAEVSLGFMSLFDAFRDVLDGCRKALKRGVDALEACGDAAEEFHLLVLVGSTHGR